MGWFERVSSGILLDTCAIIWIAEAAPLAPEAVASLNAAWATKGPILVSPISAWEVGLLAARGRLVIATPAERWWAQFMERSGADLAPMPPGLLIASSNLPGGPPNDPADRIIAATAREHDLRLMTRDRRLLDYGAAGHVKTIVC
jgi:PIN domain nuclease of toxin-antitoxin system